MGPASNNSPQTISTPVLQSRNRVQAIADMPARASDKIFLRPHGGQDASSGNRLLAAPQAPTRRCSIACLRALECGQLPPKVADCRVERPAIQVTTPSVWTQRPAKDLRKGVRLHHCAARRTTSCDSQHAVHRALLPGPASALNPPVNVVETSTELLQPLQRRMQSWNTQSVLSCDAALKVGGCRRLCWLARTRTLRTPSVTPRAVPQDPCCNRESRTRQVRVWYVHAHSDESRWTDTQRSLTTRGAW